MPTEVQKYIKEHIVDPLDTFRSKVAPLNDNQIDGVADFAKTIAGLLTGSDGQLAFQGPAADNLTNLINEYLAKEDKLTGAEPGVLQGRLQDAAHICERYAKYIEGNVLGYTSTSSSSGNAAGYLYGIAASILGVMDEGNGQNEGGETPEEAARTELDTQSLSFETDLQSGPGQVSLQDLTQLPELELTLPPPENPVNVPAGENPETSTLGLSPEQEQLAEQLTNDYEDSGVTLDQMREIVQEEYRAHPNWTDDQHEANIRDFFQSLTPEEREKINERGLSYSDVFTITDEHPGLSNSAAIDALTGPPGTTPQIGGARTAGADIRFVDSNGNVVLARDVKVFQGGSYRSFRNLISSATDQTGGTGEVYMQVPDADQARAYLDQFRRGPLGQDTARFGHMRIIIVDANGNVIIDEPLIPNP